MAEMELHMDVLLDQIDELHKQRMEIDTGLLKSFRNELECEYIRLKSQPNKNRWSHSLCSHLEFYVNENEYLLWSSYVDHSNYKAFNMGIIDDLYLHSWISVEECTKLVKLIDSLKFLWIYRVEIQRLKLRSPLTNFMVGFREFIEDLNTLHMRTHFNFVLKRCVNFGKYNEFMSKKQISLFSAGRIDIYDVINSAKCNKPRVCFKCKSISSGSYNYGFTIE